MQTAEQGILERIKVSRGTSEPATAPTEDPQVVNVSEDQPIKDAVETEALANEQIAPEIEESEEEITEAQADDTEESFFTMTLTVKK